MSGRQITAAVNSGILTRVRRDRYAVPNTSGDVIEAVRIGGRLSCLSLLRTMGVFVHRCDVLHVHAVPGTSRIRTPRDDQTKLHWHAQIGDDRALHAAPLLDAVAQSVRCQQPRAALATLDSLLHHGVMTEAMLADVFASLPGRYLPLRALVDSSAASGPETFMRLILRALGLQFQTQVELPGVGFVDFVVEGWLIIECDSKEFHEGWDKQVEDRRRDTAAAALGYVTLRPLATDIMGDAERVRSTLAEVIAVLGPLFTTPGRSQLLKK